MPTLPDDAVLEQSLRENMAKVDRLIDTIVRPVPTPRVDAKVRRLQEQFPHLPTRLTFASEHLTVLTPGDAPYDLAAWLDHQIMQYEAMGHEAGKLVAWELQGLLGEVKALKATTADQVWDRRACLAMPDDEMEEF